MPPKPLPGDHSPSAGAAVAPCVSYAYLTDFAKKGPLDNPMEPRIGSFLISENVGPDSLLPYGNSYIVKTTLYI